MNLLMVTLTDDDYRIIKTIMELEGLDSEQEALLWALRRTPRGLLRRGVITVPTVGRNDTVKKRKRKMLSLGRSNFDDINETEVPEPQPDPQARR